jgi:DNA-3-methyladenine glycosylase II
MTTARNDPGERAYRELAAADPVLAGLVTAYGHPDPFAWHDGGRTGDSRFAALTLHIIGQQISAAVAFTVFDRLAAAAGGVPRPETVRDLDADRLRGIGLSRAKARYVRALAEAQASGAIDVEHLDDLGDDAVIAALTAVPGIGPWTAQTFLIHQMRRPDVLPAGDAGIRRAIRTAWALDRDPAITEVRERAEPWAPWRTYAAALLWTSLAPPGGISDPKARALNRAASRHWVVQPNPG